MSRTEAPAEILIALLNAREGREDEFNAWYTEEHLPEVVRLPGILTAQRYEIPEALLGRLPYRYATVYRVEGSAAAALQEILSAEFSSNSEAIDAEQMVFSPFAPLGAPIAAE
ncbi:hypothetical protein J4H92_05105 [Leucobacter weissii]|uniref:Uncharacterized protein n=1 Tax=Leucobacter weissii TaxID=1983706 RepID=A0A939MI17_9MICO|nr:DUF4286 family protein [Leucobacter weissii]MBO1901323.1 hypothetical protein [Leucobacter weissii]